jgi:arylformamidase
MGSATAEWPGDVPFSCGWTTRREDGSSVNLGVLTTSPHVGTHADAPVHVESAWSASESLPVHAFVGTALVIDVPAHARESRCITRPLLETLFGAAGIVNAVPERVLCRTGITIAHGAFPEDWPVLDEATAGWLARSGLRLWGVDAPSVDARTSTALPVHHALFAAGAFILENLSLDAIEPGRYELLAQPLAIHGADAAPVRALLRAMGPGRGS